MSFIPMALMIGGTAMKMIGDIKASQSQAAAQEYNAKVAMAQAEMTRRAGEFEIAGLKQVGAYEETKLKRAKGRMTSAQRARYAKAGVLLEGSPLEVIADTAAQYEMDIAANRYNMQLGITTAKYGAEVGVSKAKSEAQYLKQAAGRTRTAGYWGAGRTLLTSVGKYYSK